jgi:hypothetical protein
MEKAYLCYHFYDFERAAMLIDTIHTVAIGIVL